MTVYRSQLPSSLYKKYISCINYSGSLLTLHYTLPTYLDKLIIYLCQLTSAGKNFIFFGKNSAENFLAKNFPQTDDRYFYSFNYLTD